VALVVLGVVVLHWSPAAWRRARGLPPGAGWAALTGLSIAAYSLVDKAGVARVHPVAYIGLLMLGSWLVLTPAALARRDALWHEWRGNRRAILAAGLMSPTAYCLVLFAFQLSKTGYVVAARESSIVLSALIGWLWLGEGELGRRLLGAAVVLAGVAAVALLG
jgi:drug/metabolite transporter (DMT)-like permease